MQGVTAGIEPLVPYLDSLRYLFLALTLGAILYMAFQRIHAMKVNAL